MTALSMWLVILIERRVGGTAAVRISSSFVLPVFLLFLAFNIYMIYINETVGHYLLMNTLLLTAGVSSYQDLKYREFENEIHVAALAVGLIGLAADGFSPVDSLLGLLAGGGVLLLIAVLTRGGMGGADIKLNAVYGAILGFRLSILSLLIAFTVGALVSLLLVLFRIKGRKDVIPFSPFLSIGALISFVFGNGIIDAYLGLLNI
jgi:leader peptidase (prepilin peptidase)/N-methyltransferase